MEWKGQLQILVTIIQEGTTENWIRTNNPTSQYNLVRLVPNSSCGENRRVFGGGVAVGEFGHACVMQLSGPPTWQAFWTPHLVIIPNPIVHIHYSLMLNFRLSWHKSQVNHRFIVQESICSRSWLGLVGGFLLRDQYCQTSCKNKKDNIANIIMVIEFLLSAQQMNKGMCIF